MHHCANIVGSCGEPSGESRLKRMSTSRNKLIKSRVRDTWLASIVILGVIVLTGSIWPEAGLIEETLEWSGYTLLFLCVLGRTYCSLYIGGRKNQGVIALGPYSVVRNPLYVFSFLGVMAIGFLIPSFTITTGLAALFGAYYIRVVRHEEGFLLAALGDEYAAYVRRTPRWIPRLRLWSAPAEMAVQPRYVLITMRDSAVFLIAFPLLEGLKYAHTQGLIPVLLWLP